MSVIEWKKENDGVVGYLGNILWCDWVPPDGEDGGYVYGIESDGYIFTAETLEEAKPKVEEWVKLWLDKANLMVKPEPKSMKERELRMYILKQKVALRVLEKMLPRSMDASEEHHC